MLYNISKNRYGLLIELHRKHWTLFEFVIFVFQFISIDFTIFYPEDGRSNYYKKNYTHNFNSFAQIVLNML
jgi:hypothetical protein